MRPPSARTACLAPVLACAAATGIAAPLAPYFAPANIVMLFLLSVVLVGVRAGRGPAVVSAGLNVIAFDFFFVAPRYSFAVGDAQYLLTFAVMLVVGVVTAELTAGVRRHALLAEERAGLARVLYEFARELSGTLTRGQVAEIAERSLAATFAARVRILQAADEIVLGPALEPFSPVDKVAAQQAFDAASATDGSIPTRSSGEWLFVALRSGATARGVLGLHCARPEHLMPADSLRQLKTFATLIAIALERVHYVDVARDALIKIESERLRNSLLAALSHDLRTPLAALLGLSEAMTLTQPPMSPEQVDLARTIGAETRRLIALVNNLLDMARIQSGEVKLDLQWHSLEEVVGSALAASRAALGARRVAVDIPRDLPLVQMDAVLMERVLANLLENTGKYTPPEARVAIAARTLEREVEIAVEDDGNGIPPGQEEAVFEKFVRGTWESATPGVGLGLAICRAIVEAHHGTIRAEAGRARGARFVIQLPRGEPPEVNAA